MTHKHAQIDVEKGFEREVVKVARNSADFMYKLKGYDAALAEWKASTGRRGEIDAYDRAFKERLDELNAASDDLMI